MKDCLFCQMAAGEVKPDIVHQDEQVLAFRDISPQAPVHVLVIPRKHIENAHALTGHHDALLGHMFSTARKVAEVEGVSETGYRLVFNCNEDGGQSVGHLHLHVLGGRRMAWPPG